MRRMSGTMARANVACASTSGSGTGVTGMGSTLACRAPPSGLWLWEARAVDSAKGGLVFLTNKQWRLLRSIAGIGTAVVTFHGVTSKTWRKWNTAIVVLGLVASIGATLTKPDGAPEQPVVDLKV